MGHVSTLIVIGGSALCGEVSDLFDLFDLFELKYRIAL